jgi:hypothetical protein
VGETIDMLELKQKEDSLTAEERRILRNARSTRSRRTRSKKETGPWSYNSTSGESGADIAATVEQGEDGNWWLKLYEGYGPDEADNNILGLVDEPVVFATRDAAIEEGRKWIQERE